MQFLSAVVPGHQSAQGTSCFTATCWSTCLRRKCSLPRKVSLLTIHLHPHTITGRGRAGRCLGFWLLGFSQLRHSDLSKRESELTRSSLSARLPPNDRHCRIRGYPPSRLSDANLRRRAQGPGSISRRLVLFRHFSAYAATAAHLRSPGGLRVCRCRPGNLSPHRTAGHGYPLR